MCGKGMSMNSSNMSVMIGVFPSGIEKRLYGKGSAAKLLRSVGRGCHLSLAAIPLVDSVQCHHFEKSCFLSIEKRDIIMGLPRHHGS